LTPVGMSLALVQRTPFERTGTAATSSPAVMSALPYPERSIKIGISAHVR
jgi:hypothetical protein